MSFLTKHVENEAEGSPLSKKDEMCLKKAVTNRTRFCRHPLQLAACLLHPNERGQILSEGNLQLAYESSISVTKWSQEKSNTTVREDQSNLEAIVTTEIESHRAKQGMLWSRELVWKAARDIDHFSWWRGLCSNSILASLAIIILSLPAVSAFSERNLSAFENIHITHRKEKSSHQ